jgi:hypothetical protein
MTANTPKTPISALIRRAMVTPVETLRYQTIARSCHGGER